MAISLAAGLIGLFAVSGVSIGGVVVYKMVESKQQARQEREVSQQTKEVVEQTTTGQQAKAAGTSTLNTEVQKAIDESNKDAVYVPQEVQKDLGTLKTQQGNYDSAFTQIKADITSANSTHTQKVTAEQEKLTKLWTEEEARLKAKKTELESSVNTAQSSVNDLTTAVDTLKKEIDDSINTHFSK